MKKLQLMDTMRPEDRPFRGILDESGYDLCGVNQCKDMSCGVRCYQPCYDNGGLCYYHAKKKAGRIK